MKVDWTFEYKVWCIIILCKFNDKVDLAKNSYSYHYRYNRCFPSSSLKIEDNHIIN